MTARERRAADDRLLGQTWAEAYFALAPGTTSAWAWFLCKSSGVTSAARRRWDACDMDRQLRDWTTRLDDTR